MASPVSPAEVPARRAEEAEDVNRVLLATSSPSRQRERRLTPPHARRVLPPRPCMLAATASIVPLASLIRTGSGGATLFTSSPLTACRPSASADGTSSMPSSCGATAEAESRLSTAQSHLIAPAGLPTPAVVTCASLPSSSTVTGGAARGGSCSARPSPLMRHRTFSLDGPSLLPLSYSGTSPLTLNPTCVAASSTAAAAATTSAIPVDLFRVCRDESVEDVVVGRLSPPQRSPISAEPLLCCAPPPRDVGELERRATTAASFLAEVPAVLAAPFEECEDGCGERGGPARLPSQPLSPITGAGRVVVPCSNSCEGLDCVHERHGGSSCVGSVESPLRVPVCSPTSHIVSPHTSVCVGAPASPSRVTPQRRSRSFDTPLPFGAGAPGVGCDDFSRCYAERRHLSITASTRTSEYARDRHDDPCRPTALMHPTDSAVTLSTLTTPVAGAAGTPAPSVSTRSGGGGSAGTAAAPGSPVNARACDVDRSPLLAAGPAGAGGLYRTVSCDTLASVSSTRSRPLLTPAAQGPPVASVAASVTTSTTTSVTYTRKNVCLGTLDFYGNPVTSLSTLLVQMSMRSGDHDEMDPIDPRGAAAAQFPSSAAAAQQQQQQQARNTLSMQNLKAHTQQVGELAPEDKVERFQAKRDAGAACLSTTTNTATGASMSVSNAASTALPRRRRAYGRGGSMGYAMIGCPAVPISGFSTLNGPTTTTPAAASSSSTPAPTKPQVGSLKDVLQECNFLSLNDVLTAIAETHVSELREAQQQLAGGTPKPPGNEGCGFTGSAGGSMGDVFSNSTLSGLTATAGTCSSTTTTTANAVPPGAVSPAPPPTTARSRSSATVSPSSATVPCLCSRAGAGAAVGGDAGGGGGTTSDLTCSPSLREGDSGACMCTSGSTTATGIPALQPSVASLDPQHALSLAAAITEMSLNLDRSTEASLTASTMLTVASPPPASLTSRRHLSRRASNTADFFCTGDRTSSTAVSVSFPNLLSDACATGIGVSNPSTITTPTRLRSMTRSTSHASSAFADACRAPPVSGTFFGPAVATTAPPAPAVEGIAAVLADAVSVNFPDDPLERKVLRGGGRGNDDEDGGSSGGADGDGGGDDPLERGFWGSGTLDRSLHAPPPPSPPEGATAAVSPVTTTSALRPASSAPAARVHGGRYVANWHGLSSAEETPLRAMQSRTLTAAELQLSQLATALSGPSSELDKEKGRANTPGTLADVTVCGSLPRGRCGDVGGTGGFTEVSSQEATTLTTTAGASVSVGEVRVVIGSVACGAFDDELTAAAQLRRWARSVAAMEHLLPCTDTEVTT